MSLEARPNPFAAATTIRFELAQPADVSLEIYDVRGRLVRNVVDGRPMEAAAHELAWDGRDARGRAVGAGVYFARLTVGSVRVTEKLLHVRVK
jgi:flagellar hook assembly protein FlgD